MTTVVLLHGLWLSHRSWQPWIDRFAEAGYDAVAPAWPGEADTVEATRANPEAQAGVGLDRLVEHLAGQLPPRAEQPVVVGHSFGGLLAQQLLARDLVAAAVAISPAPIRGVKGLPLAQLRSALPVLGNPRNRTRAKALSRRQFRYGFGNALPREESDALWAQWGIPSPGRPLFEVASANSDESSPAAVDTARADRGPLLMIAAGRDHTVPQSTTEKAHALYAGSTAVTDLHRFDDRGHSLTVDHGWGEVFDDVLAWLTTHVPTGRTLRP
jgi:pimeloyl-ACP methyl ester carboxylesterase